MNNLCFRVFFLLIILSGFAFGNAWSESKCYKFNRSFEDATQDSIVRGNLNELLRLASVYVNKPGEKEDDLSKAIGYGHRALVLSEQQHALLPEIAAYSILSQCYREKKEVNKGRTFAEKAVRLLPKGSVTMEASDALAEFSTYYDAANNDSLIRKINYFEQSVNMLRKVAPRSRKLADRLKFLGDLKNSKFDLTGAISLLKESLSLYRALGVKELQDIYDLLGDALTTSGNTVEGLAYQLKALKTAEQYKDTSQMICTIYYRLAFTYNAINQDNRTAEYMEKARYYAHRNHNLNDWVMISSNLGTTYNKLRRYKEAVKICEEALTRCAPTDYQNRASLITNLLYTAVVTKSFEKATRFYNQLKQLTEIHNLELSTGDAAMVEYLIATRKFSEARVWIDKFAALANVTHSLISKEKIAHYQFQVDSAAGNFLSAIAHQRMEYLLRDSLISRNYNKQIGRMQLTIDLQKKDQEIAFKAKHINLLTHQNLLQTNALRNQKIIRNLFIASLILLVLLLGVVYNRYQLKQKANNELQEQQEEINTQNESLRQLLEEREWLLKEVHHRVKNNLQIVISLLNSQLTHIKDVVAIDVIRESQNRMRSISLIHQKLYQFDSLATIDASDYIKEIVFYLQDSFDTIGQIKFTTDIDPVTLDVSQAVPIGLILNEAITNSIKYAFTGQTDKQVNISIYQVEKDKVCLTIRDNGKGLPSDFDMKQCKSLGMQLMTGLSRQIRAQISFMSKNGLIIKLEWQRSDPFSAAGKNPVANQTHEAPVSFSSL